MRIKQCIHHDCTDFSTDSTQLCDTHLKEHIERCRAIKSALNTEGDELIGERK